MRFSKNEPGFIASAAVHTALLVAGVVAFSSTPKFADQQESIAVEVISDEAFSTMTKGDRTAKTVQENPKPRVDKVAEIEEEKPDPGEAKRDVPAPTARPMAEDKSEDRAAVEPTPEPKPEPAKTEPVKQAETVPTPTPPVPRPRPQEVAQIEEPKPEPKPEPEPKLEPKPEPKKPEPKKPEPKPEPKKPEPKKVAVNKEPVKAASRSTSEKSFDTDAIEKLLASKDKAQTAGSTGREMQTASAGTRTGNSPKLSLSQRDAIGNMMKEQIGRCFSAPPGLAEVSSSPVIKVSLNEDGTLASPPQIVSGADDAASRSFAESLMRAIRRCAPYSFPAQFAPYYNDWRDWRIDASPGDFLG